MTYRLCIPIPGYSAGMMMSPSTYTSAFAKNKPPVTLKQVVAAAADYGAYVPMLIGKILTVWHYDSGAGISQKISPEALKELLPYLEKVDWLGSDPVCHRQEYFKDPYDLISGELMCIASDGVRDPIPVSSHVCGV